MTDERETTTTNQAIPESSLGFQAWSAGWLMGIGFGVLVMFIATELPNNFFERARYFLAAAGVATFVFGTIQCRSANLLRKVFTPRG